MPTAHTTTRTHSLRRHHHHDDDDDDVSSFDSLSDSSSQTSSSHDGLAAKLSTLPDLRFEQFYLATIRGFLHEDQPSNPPKDADEKDHHRKVDVTQSEVKDEHELWLGNLRVEWFPIVYVTVRDQLLSPLIQGAAWGLGGLLLSQFRQYLSARARGAPKGAPGGQRGTRSVLRSVGLGKR